MQGWLGTIMVVGAWRLFLLLAVLLLLTAGTRVLGRWAYVFGAFLGLMAISGLLVKTVATMTLRLLPFLVLLLLLYRLFGRKK